MKYNPNPKSNLKPREIVAELDRFIIGQEQAKKAVAIALRNRWRRHKLPPGIREEVMPKNILMIGPTGCGKTEVARRLAKLTNAPFLKVEATKFTEVGFHGRDVDSIIRDLVRAAISMTRQRKRNELKQQVEKIVEEKIFDGLLGSGQPDRSKFLERLRAGMFEDIKIEIEVPIKEPDIPTNVLVAFAHRPMGKKTEKMTLPVRECRKILEESETESLLSLEDLTKEAIKHVEEDGIVFIDEIDKIVSNTEMSHRSADASAEGVQRDLLPLLEGTTVSTKFGNVDTDHILFIASGAFHSVKPSDMLAELQGRLPIRVELKGLTENDLHRILTETENNLIQQQIALLSTENTTLKFTDGAIRLIAKIAHEVNLIAENIGARRLHTVIERIMTDISFDAADNPGVEHIVDEEHIEKMVAELRKKSDLNKFIL